MYHDDCVAAHIVVKMNILIKCVKDQAIIYKHANAMVTGTVCDLKQTCVGGSVHTLMAWIHLEILGVADTQVEL